MRDLTLFMYKNQFIPEAKKSNINFLFIIGMPRSGTSILRRCFKGLDSFFLFNEILSSDKCPTPRFFQSRDRLEKISMSAVNEAVYRKLLKSQFERQTYIGGKFPGFNVHFKKMRYEFADYSVFYLHTIRPLRHLAESYEKRARDCCDKWRRSRGWISCVVEFEVYLENLLKDLDCGFKHHQHLFIPHVEINNLGFWHDYISSFLLISEGDLEKINSQLLKIWKVSKIEHKEIFFSNNEFMAIVEESNIKCLLNLLEEKHSITLPIW